MIRTAPPISEPLLDLREAAGLCSLDRIIFARGELYGTEYHLMWTAKFTYVGSGRYLRPGQIVTKGTPTAKPPANYQIDYVGANEVKLTPWNQGPAGDSDDSEEGRLSRWPVGWNDQCGSEARREDLFRQTPTPQRRIRQGPLDRSLISAARLLVQARAMDPLWAALTPFSLGFAASHSGGTYREIPSEPSICYDAISSMEGSDVTALLRAWGSGDESVSDELFQAIYGQLRLLARHHLRLRPGSTLTPTVLINEAFVELAADPKNDWRDRVQFFAFTATVMRRLMSAHARRRNAAKRGANVHPIGFDESAHPVFDRGLDAAKLDDALTWLDERSRGDPGSIRAYGDPAVGIGEGVAGRRTGRREHPGCGRTGLDRHRCTPRSPGPPGHDALGAARLHDGRTRPSLRSTLATLRERPGWRHIQRKRFLKSPMPDPMDRARVGDEPLLGVHHVGDNRIDPAQMTRPLRFQPREDIVPDAKRNKRRL